MHQSLAVNISIFFYKKWNSAISNSGIRVLIVYIIKNKNFYLQQLI